MGKERLAHSWPISYCIEFRLVQRLLYLTNSPTICGGLNSMEFYMERQSTFGQDIRLHRSSCTGLTQCSSSSFYRIHATLLILQWLRRLFTDPTPSAWSLLGRYWFRAGLAIFASVNWQQPARFYTNMLPFYRGLLQLWRPLSTRIV